LINQDSDDHDDDNNYNEGIRMVTIRFVIACAALIKDWFMLIVIIDHMLQEVRKRYTTGFDAYVKSPAVEYVMGMEEWKKNEKYRRMNSRPGKLGRGDSIGSNSNSRNRQRGGENSSNNNSSANSTSVSTFSTSFMSGLSLNSSNGRSSKDSSVSELVLENENEIDHNPLRQFEPLSKKEKEKMIKKFINESWIVIACKWWKKNRLWCSRLLLVSGWGGIVYALSLYFRYVLNILDSEEVDTKVV
jgi:hypothetical protein